MKEKTLNIVISSVKFLNEYLESEYLKEPTEKTLLYGSGTISSLNLVMLLSDIEKTIKKEMGKSIVIADDKAMSSINSPFKDVKSLANFIISKL